MKKFSTRAAFFVVAIIFATYPALAQGTGGCGSYPDVPVNINPVFDEPRYDFSQNLAALQAIAHEPGHSIPQYHAITMGITRYSPIMEINVPIEVETAADVSCARVKRVDVTVGYRDVTVFIANEIPQGSCDFSETMGHEQKHIKVNRELLREFAPRIAAEIKSYMRLYGAFRVSKAEDAEPFLREKLDGILNNMVGQMEEENVHRQQLVDSHSEYERLTHVCGGDLSKIAEDYRKTER